MGAVTKLICVDFSILYRGYFAVQVNQKRLNYIDKYTETVDLNRNMLFFTSNVYTISSTALPPGCGEASHQ